MRIIYLKTHGKGQLLEKNHKMSKWSEVIEKLSRQITIEESKMIIKAFFRQKKKKWAMNKVSFIQLPRTSLPSQGTPVLRRSGELRARGHHERRLDVSPTPATVLVPFSLWTLTFKVKV